MIDPNRTALGMSYDDFCQPAEDDRDLCPRCREEIEYDDDGRKHCRCCEQCAVKMPFSFDEDDFEDDPIPF